MILEKIIDRKRLQIDEEMKQITIEELKQKITRPGLHKTIDFYEALKRGRDEYGISIIGEVKKASPSKGVIIEDFQPVEIARKYYNARVQAISVLTEKHFFMGDDEYLVKIRQQFPVPILRKDFIIDIRQVYQSRYLGADAILLIVAALKAEELKKFMIVAEILGMQCLVEVHDEYELDLALECGARIIGINNRNLKTFEVDLGTTSRLINYIPNDRLVVSESGIKDAEDIGFLKELKVDAVLIGETFMRADSIETKVNELRGCHV